MPNGGPLCCTNGLKTNQTDPHHFPCLDLFLEEGRGKEGHSYERRINMRIAANSINSCSKRRAQLTQVVSHVFLDNLKNANQMLTQGITCQSTNFASKSER